MDHTTSYCGIPNGKFHIDVVKQNSVGQYTNTIAGQTVSGTDSWTLTYSNVPTGVFKLHFYRDDVYTSGTWDISRTVRK